MMALSCALTSTRTAVLRRASPLVHRQLVHARKHTVIAMVEKSALADTTKDGAFNRQASVWRDTIAKGTRFEPEAGRYHLYISLAPGPAGRSSRCTSKVRAQGSLRSTLASVLGSSRPPPRLRDLDVHVTGRHRRRAQC